MDGPRPQPQPQPLALGGIEALPQAASPRAGRRAVRSDAAAAAEAPGQPFEEGLAELEQIVAALEAGDLGLDAALALYERGVGLVRDCAAQLDAAEARIKVLSLDESGRPAVQPLEDAGA